MQNSLTMLDRAARTLSQCVDVDEVKGIRDRAKALEIYARQQKQSVTMERDCGIIRLRCERRLGELLARTVRAGNPQLSHEATIGLGSLGITRNQSSRWQIASTLPKEEFEEYLCGRGELTTNAVLRLVKAKEQPPMGGRSGGHVLTGDMSRLFDDLDDGSVDLFLTDPPYAEINLYSELAKLAAAKLKPGGLCLAYSGIWYLPKVFETLAKHLAYHWTFAIEFSGPNIPLHPKRIFNSYQAVVAFSKGKSAAGWIGDHLHSEGREKGLHKWEKSLTDAEYLIEKLSLPGALVVDPFCGSGTVPAACKKLGRRWLCCELDSQTARVARGRVAA